MKNSYGVQLFVKTVFVLLRTFRLLGIKTYGLTEQLCGRLKVALM
jgi:hypothetical protein